MGFAKNTIWKIIKIRHHAWENLPEWLKCWYKKMRINLQNILLTLLVVATLYKSSGAMAYMGLLSLATIVFITALMCLYIATTGTLPKKRLSPFYYFFVLLIMSIVSISYSSDVYIGVKNSAILLYLICFSALIAKSNWSLRNFENISFLILVLVFINIIFVLNQNNSGFFTGVYQHKNSLGGFFVLLTFFVVLNIKATKHFGKKILSYIALIAIVFLLLLSMSRNSWLVMLAVITTYYAWGKIVKSAARSKFYFLLISVFVIGIFPVYMWLYTSGLGEPIDVWFKSELGYGLFTGRERLWLPIYEAITQKPIFGYGVGFLPANITGEDLSAHNLFLQTTLQLGIIGLVVIMLGLNSVWSKLSGSPESEMSRLSGSYFIGVVVSQGFEVSLTQNSFPMALIQWTIIGIGLSKSSRVLVFHNANFNHKVSQVKT